MLKPRSALEGKAKFEMAGLALSEAPDFTLTQIAGDEKTLKKIFGKLPEFGVAKNNVLRIGPSQFWVLGEVPAAKNCFLTPLSSSRTRILVEGKLATSLLQACAAIDFGGMKPADFVMTGMHHVPVTVHCLAEDKFHLYVMRTFALSIWDWLVDTTGGLIVA